MEYLLWLNRSTVGISGDSHNIESLPTNSGMLPIVVPVTIQGI